MKFGITLMKNLKLLFRNKESAYTIIFGPLLIILLVSFAFMGSSDDYTVRVATYAPEHTDLSIKTIDTLNKNNYLVSTYGDNTSCVDSVRVGDTHACLVFSTDESGNGSIPVTFYLDLSRINIVYQIIDDLSAGLDIQADAIRRQLTADTQTRIDTATVILGEELEKTPEIVEVLTELEKQLAKVQDALVTIPDEEERNLTNLHLLKGYNQGLAQNTRRAAEISIDALDEATLLIHDLEKECDNCSKAMEERIDNLKKDVNDIKDELNLLADDSTKDRLSEANLLIEYAMEDVEAAGEAVKNATSAGATITDTLTESYAEVTGAKTGLQRVLGRIDYTKEFLKGEATDPDAVAAPITTSIVSITVSDDQLSFAYPYLLVLVIMFIGILLASTLVVTDKISRAAFRNFTTPTSDGYHVWVGFITAFLILIVEVAVILLLSSFFVAQPLLLNFWSTMFIVCVAIILFTFLGMIIGYLSKTQEASMIASISVASVLLFVSNLVLPLEGMTRLVQSLSAINPYIVLSELLKKSMLYGVTANQVWGDLAILLVSAVVLLIITIFVQRHFKKKYFKQEELLIQLKQHRVAAPLRLGEVYVHDALELMDVLDRMTRSEFEACIKSRHVIAEWVEKELKSKRLARQLRTRSKERMLLRLDKYLERHAKNIKR